MTWIPPTDTDPEDKAGYNSAGKITELLSMLRSTFITSMMRNDFPSSLECCRGVIDIISGKVNKEEIRKMNCLVYSLDDSLSISERIYTHNGGKFYENPDARKIIKKNLEFLWRKIEDVQDRYGYGMFSEDDSGL